METLLNQSIATGERTTATEPRAARGFSTVDPAVLLNRIDWNLQCANISPNHHFSLVMVAVDNLWLYADCLGTHAADTLLTAAALSIVQVLGAECRFVHQPHGAHGDDGGIMVSHMEGDVLAVLLEASADVGGAQVGRRIREALFRLSPTPDLDAFATATLGFVEVRYGHQVHQSAMQVMRDARAAMHHARSRGRGWSCVFQPDMRRSAASRLQLECDLRRAVNRREFSLVYQPIVALESGALTGFEALLRWQRPDGRFVSPADFIPLAEETGLVWPIGEFVLQEVCKQLAIWRRRKEVMMNVNVSRRQFAEEGLTELVAAVMKQHAIPAKTLVLEITESSLLEDVSSVMGVMNRLTAAGVSLCLDDFGTGYSSLASLHQFPIRGLKIDRSFIVSASGRRDYAAVLQAIVMLADNLELEVVGEGVETPEQLALLQSLNCPKGQGYLFGKPLFAQEAERLLEHGLLLPA